MRTDREGEEYRTTIGEHSTVKLGLVAVLLGLFLGGLGTTIWWAATMSTKLDAIAAQLLSQNANLSRALMELDDLKAWRKVIDTVGSPRVLSVERDVMELRNRLEMHDIQSRSRNPVVSPKDRP